MKTKIRRLWTINWNEKDLTKILDYTPEEAVERYCKKYLPAFNVITQVDHTYTLMSPHGALSTLTVDKSELYIDP